MSPNVTHVINRNNRLTKKVLGLYNHLHSFSTEYGLRYFLRRKLFEVINEVWVRCECFRDSLGLPADAGSPFVFNAMAMCGGNGVIAS